MAGRGRTVLLLMLVAVLLTVGAVGCGGDEETGGGTAAVSGSRDGGTDAAPDLQKGSGEDENSSAGKSGQRADSGTGTSGRQGSGDDSASQDDPGGDGSDRGGSPGDGSSSGGSQGGRSGGGSEEFVVPGGDNSIQNFGDEAGSAEREAASAVLETYLTARAAGNNKVACANIAKAAYEQLEDLIPDASGCVAVLDGIDGRSQPADRANKFDPPIASLRVEEDRGFALFHGTDGVDYTAQMTKEGGAWKVSSLVPFPLS